MVAALPTWTNISILLRRTLCLARRVISLFVYQQVIVRLGTATFVTRQLVLTNRVLRLTRRFSTFSTYLLVNYFGNERVLQTTYYRPNVDRLTGNMNRQRTRKGLRQYGKGRYYRNLPRGNATREAWGSRRHAFKGLGTTRLNRANGRVGLIHRRHRHACCQDGCGRANTNDDPATSVLDLLVHVGDVFGFIFVRALYRFLASFVRLAGRFTFCGCVVRRDEQTGR